MRVPDRKLNRLAGYDYSRDGLYFVTICTHNRVEWFGCVEDGTVSLNDIGAIVDGRWQWLGQQYPHVDLGPYVIMPNHIHALIGIQTSVGNGRDRSGPVATSPYRRKSLSGLVGAFKTTSSKAIHLAGSTQFRWQKSFHDSIVRNGRSLARITQYIHDNPPQWLTDSENQESRAQPADTPSGDPSVRQ